MLAHNFVFKSGAASTAQGSALLPPIAFTSILFAWYIWSSTIYPLADWKKYQNANNSRLQAHLPPLLLKIAQGACLWIW